MYFLRGGSPPAGNEPVLWPFTTGSVLLSFLSEIITTSSFSLSLSPILIVHVACCWVLVSVAGLVSMTGESGLGREVKDILTAGIGGESRAFTVSSTVSSGEGDSIVMFIVVTLFSVTATLLSGTDTLTSSILVTGIASGDGGYKKHWSWIQLEI